MPFFAHWLTWPLDNSPPTPVSSSIVLRETVYNLFTCNLCFTAGMFCMLERRAHITKRVGWQEGVGRITCRHSQKSICTSKWSGDIPRQGGNNWAIFWAMIHCFRDMVKNRQFLITSLFISEDTPIMWIHIYHESINFTPMLLCSCTPTRRWSLQQLVTKEIDYSPPMWDTGSTISAIFIPQSILNSPCFFPHLIFCKLHLFAIPHSSKYTNPMNIVISLQLQSFKHWQNVQKVHSTKTPHWYE